MSAALETYFETLRRARLALHEAEITAHRIAAAELRLAEDHANVRELRDAEVAFAFAARDYVLAVDRLPQDRQPKGWAA